MPTIAQTFDLNQIVMSPGEGETSCLVNTAHFNRVCVSAPEQISLTLDTFTSTPGVCCCFVRISPDEGRNVGFTVEGEYELILSASGGWVLKSLEPEVPSYWIPGVPVARSLDKNQRILDEQPVTIVSSEISSRRFAIEIKLPGAYHTDLVFWRFSPDSASLLDDLKQPCSLETQQVYFWNSQTVFKQLSDLYLYLVNGFIYTNRFVYPRKWKICCELDAYGLFVTLSGLEHATGKSFYTYLRQQIVASVMSRQSQDGGWYHGEFTDLMESHYRFQNGALLLLDSALMEWPDSTIENALKKGMAFVAGKTDTLDYGVWFLHDSLEDSVESMNAGWRERGGRWVPNTMLGKSPTNKLILNTHLDTLVTLHKCQETTGDTQYSEKLNSAMNATRSLLALRPAEQIYRLAYWAIGLTLLPASKARSLSLPLRAFKRITWKYLLPQMYKLKQAYPRFVMPGGLIERHLSMVFWGSGYFTVNIMDLTRVWRRFPDEDLGDIINNSIRAVSDTGFLEKSAERVPLKYVLVVHVDALYRLCVLKSDITYRDLLAQAIIQVEDAQLGMPPVLLGADCEIIPKAGQVPCPSPIDPRLRIANLCHHDHTELVVVNSTASDINLAWQGRPPPANAWTDQNGTAVVETGDTLIVPARGWLLGKT